MVEISFGELLDKAFKRYRDKIAFKIGGRAFTYKDVEVATNKLSNALLSLGLEKGDRVAIMTVNRIEYIYADFASAKAGLVKVPMDVMLTQQDIDYRIKDSEACVVILDEVFHKKFGLFFKDYDFVKNIIYITEKKKPLGKGVTDFYELLEDFPSSKPDVSIDQDDLLAIMYTGGTTGLAKGVMHTHKSYVSIIYSEIIETDINEGEIMLHTAPFAHAAGFLIPPGLLRGATIIVTNGFDPEEFFRIVQDERVTWTFVVPTMIYALLDHPKRKDYDLSSLKTLGYGAAPISPRRLGEAINEIGPILAQGYSQMEVANQTCVFTKKEHIEAIKKNKKERLKSCGMPITMSQVKIVDENDKEVKVGEVGELVTRGPHMMKGYWRKDEETKNAIIDGWLHTGDLATMDEDGYIYLVDRKKDMIITGGLNVYSSEVENVLLQHPAVAEAIVIGIPDERWGERVSGVVVKALGKDVSESELLKYCKNRLASYSRPKQIEFYDSLPKTVYGKSDKNTVRDKYWEGRDRKI